MKMKAIGLTFAALAALTAAAPASGPSVDIIAPADHSHVAWQTQAPYAVTVSYDGKSTKFGEIPSNQVVVRAAYVPNADVRLATAPLPEALVDISRSNCTGCHDFSGSSAGPSFAAIGKRYAGRAAAVAMLADHIRGGSHGSWSGGTMPPHPEMTAAQAAGIARWIVTQAGNPAVHYSVGKSGSFRMTPAGSPGPHAGVIVTAFYTGPLKPGDTRQAASGRSRVVVYGSAH